MRIRTAKEEDAPRLLLKHYPYLIGDRITGYTYAHRLSKCPDFFPSRQ